MSSIGTLRFDDVTGYIIPSTAKRTEVVENPALVQTRLDIAIAPSSVLTFTGFSATDIADLVYALPGSTVYATDQSGRARFVYVDEVEGFSQVDGQGPSPGFYCVMRVRVTAWS